MNDNLTGNTRLLRRVHETLVVRFNSGSVLVLCEFDFFSENIAYTSHAVRMS